MERRLWFSWVGTPQGPCGSSVCVCVLALTCVLVWEAAKNGPIYDVAWSPNSSEFCVVFGFMPAKATVYNLKCDPVFDFGTGPRNAVYYR